METNGANELGHHLNDFIQDKENEGDTKKGRSLLALDIPFSIGPQSQE